jgi:hypothetical protein
MIEMVLREIKSREELAILKKQQIRDKYLIDKLEAEIKIAEVNTRNAKTQKLKNKNAKRIHALKIKLLRTRSRVKHNGEVLRHFER